MFNKIKESTHNFIKVPFNKYLTIILALVGILLFAIELVPTQQQTQNETKLEVHFFYMDGCSHCTAQKLFNQKLISEFPNIKIIEHNINIPGEQKILSIMAQECNQQMPQGVPVTFIDKVMIAGFTSEETTGEQIRQAIINHEQNCSVVQNRIDIKQRLKEFEIPFIGKADLSNMSIAFLAVVLGLIDGFNPCAMWVLVYLISIAMELGNRKKMIIIVGTFIVSGALFYFLYLTTWLNAFLFLGYSRLIMISVGVIAIGSGTLSVKEFVETKGRIECTVENPEEKKRTMSNIDSIFSAPFMLSSIIAIIMLAFAINAFEFVCSFAIPVVFTQALALNNLPFLEHYFYILVYDFFYMLDDIVVFGITIFILSNNIGQKYAGYSKIIGGVLLLVIGLLLLFAPDLLI